MTEILGNLHFDLKALPSTNECSHWIPTPRQIAALERSEREVLFGGARGGGKTEVGQVWLLEDYANPLFRGLVIRENAVDLDDWVDRARTFYSSIEGITISGNPVRIRFPDKDGKPRKGGIVRIGHMNSADAYRKYIGHEYMKILVEELTLIPTRIQYEMLISTLRSAVPGKSPQVLATTNPGNIGHQWVKDYFVEPKRQDGSRCPQGETFYDKFGASRIFIQSKIFDNPHLVKNDPIYVRKLQGIPDENVRKAWLHGDWDVFSGQFFSMWAEYVHVKSSKDFLISPDWKRYRAIDPAFRNPTSCLWAAVDFEGNIYIYREMLECKLTTPQASEYIKELSLDEKYVNTWLDPNAKKSSADGSKKSMDGATRHSVKDEFAQHGIFTTLANNDRSGGWNHIKSLFHWQDEPDKPKIMPRLYIMDTCPQLIAHLPSAVYHDIKLDDINQRELDGHYHWDDLDALRYLCMGISGKTRKSARKDKGPVSAFINKITKRKKASNSWNRRD